MSEKDERIAVSEDDFIKLKSLYNTAVATGQDSFEVILDGVEREVLTSYAKYLIEYLQPQFDK